MSWTSEDDPPSSRPSDDAAEPDENSAEFDDEGPLDPSVFDGLFDDLAGDDDRHEPLDNPLDEFLNVTLTSDIDGETIDDAIDATRDTTPIDDDLRAVDDVEPVDEPAGDDHLDEGDRETLVVIDEVREPGGSFLTPDDEDIDEADGGPMPPSMPMPFDGDEEAAHQDLGRFSTEPGHGLDDRWLGEPSIDDGLDRLPIDERPWPDEVTDDHQQELEAVADHVVPDGGELESRPVESLLGPEPDAFEHPAVEPLPHRDAGPFMASPEIQHDPHPEFEDEPDPAPVDEEPVAAGGDERTYRPRRVLAALAIAIVVGSSLGVAGAMLLTRLVDGDDPSPATATGADQDGESAAAIGPSTPVAARIGLTLSALGFETEGTIPAPASSPTLELLETLVGQDPAQPIVANVRTFTESTAAEDLVLSQLQAEAIATELIDLGAEPSQVAVSGLGRSLLTSAQPVPNFVVPSAGLGPSDLADVTNAIGPFAIGFDSATASLRPESLAALDAIASVMAADPGGRNLTLAAYSFDQRDRAANETQAQLAADAAAAALAEAGIEPSRVTTIVAGDEPFAVPDHVGSHVDLRWGDAAVGALALEALDIESIDFETGSTELSPEAADTIDRLGALLVQRDDEAVIDVHSFDANEIQVRVDLSVVRAQAIGQRLLAAGVPAQRLRLHGGTSAQFRGEDRVSRMVVTLLRPPDRS